MTDLFDMLTAEHRLIVPLLDDLADRSQAFRRDVVIEHLTDALCAHMAFEEIVLHPLLGSFAEDVAATAAIEFRQVLEGLSTLHHATTPTSVDAAVESLRAVVAAHVERDERHRFLRLRAVCVEDAIDILGARYRRMREQIDIGA